MAIFKFNKRSPIFPAPLDPSTTQLAVKLGALKQLGLSPLSTCESLGIRLSGLDDVYTSLQTLLSSKPLQEVLSANPQGNLIDDVLDASMNLIDFCDTVRGLLGRFRCRIEALECALRRRKGYSNWAMDVADYVCFRKQMKKEVKKIMKRRQGKDIEIAQESCWTEMGLVREVNGINLCILNSLVGLLSSSKWGRLSSENEIERVDKAVGKRRVDYEATERDLRDVEKRMEKMEKSLESVGRGIIRIRASLLNIISR